MATGDELATAIENQRKVREAMKAAGEQAKRERDAAAAGKTAESPTPPPLGGTVAS